MTEIKNALIKNSTPVSGLLDLTVIDRFSARLNITQQPGSSIFKKINRIIDTVSKSRPDPSGGSEAVIAEYKPFITYIKLYYDKMEESVWLSKNRPLLAIVIGIMAYALSGNTNPPPINDNIMDEIKDSTIDRSLERHVKDTVSRLGLMSYNERIKKGIAAAPKKSSSIYIAWPDEAKGA